MRDYPRVCGEHLRHAARSPRNLGSSPRMRGTPRRRSQVWCHHWIIPAYAGNTDGTPVVKAIKGDHPRVCGEHMVDAGGVASIPGSSPRMRGTTSASPCRLNSVRDHPRVCGEHVKDSETPDKELGSSPRMRGTRNPWSRSHSNGGIIPAYAGNTLRINSAGIGFRDHPLVCGEHRRLRPWPDWGPGSSPRMRGTPEHC